MGQRAVVKGIVVDDPDRFDDLRAQHLDQLGLRIRAVRARSVDDDKVFPRYMRQLLHNPRHEALARRGPGDVGDHDRHPCIGGYLLPKWRGLDGTAYGRLKGRVLVGQPRQLLGGDHNRIVGHVDHHTPPPIG